VRDDGRLVGGKGWKERVYNKEEWKMLLRTARNHHILEMPMEWMNEWNCKERPTSLYILVVCPTSTV